MAPKTNGSGDSASLSDLAGAAFDKTMGKVGPSEDEGGDPKADLPGEEGAEEAKDTKDDKAAESKSKEEEAAKPEEEAADDAKDERFTAINPDDLPPELKELYKGLQADYTKKRQADSGRAREAEDQVGDMREMLETALHEIENLKSGRQEDPLVEPEALDIYEDMGEILKIENVETSAQMAEYIEQQTELTRRETLLEVSQGFEESMAPVVETISGMSQVIGKLQVDLFFANNPDAVGLEDDLVSVMDEYGCTLEEAYRGIQAPGNTATREQHLIDLGIEEGKARASRIAADKRQAAVPGSGRSATNGGDPPEDVSLKAVAGRAWDSVIVE